MTTKRRASLEGLRVLVVEDEALVSFLVEEYLTEMGCDVVATAHTLEDALEKARTLDIDGGVLDVNLNGKLSYPVADMLDERGLRVVFATGYGTSGLPSRFAGIPVLSKPFEMAQLGDALEKQPRAISRR